MLTLKGRAIQWLAQREHSRLELRRKLARIAPPEEAEDLDRRLDALLDDLERSGYLSPERFVESRVRTREARYGNLRIRQELQQHHLAVPADTAEHLKTTELTRAQSLVARRTARPLPADPEQRTKARAKLARFLTSRGFTPDTIRTVLRDT